jgi:CheY-like chemotaxis protein
LTQNITESDSQITETVLLAEDDSSVRRFLEITLRRAGYVVISAEDGAMALQKSLENRVDIAVLDAIMPNLTGHELCRIFRQHPSLQNIPLVILSGLETQTVSEADAYIVKTSNMQEELLQVLKKLLTAKKNPDLDAAKES